MQNILIVEDHLTLAQLVKTQLTQPNRQIYTAQLLATAYNFLARQHYDLVILDRGLPDGDGLELLEYIYHSQLDTRVFLISNKATTTDRIDGLQKGADDYLVKPFHLSELELRAGNLLGRLKLRDQDVQVAGEFVLYPALHQLEVHQHRIQLRPREFEIFAYLAKYMNQKVSREMLIDNLWYQDACPDTKTIDVYIRRLRILLGKRGVAITTVRGFGYMLKVTSSQPTLPAG